MPNALISASASGDTTIIAASATRRFLIKALVLVAKAAVDIQFKSGANNISGVMSLAANQSLVVPRQDSSADPWLIGVAKNEAFIINLSGAFVVGGFCVYDFLEN